MFLRLLLLLVLKQSIILTLAGQLLCYSHKPERQGEKPLLPVLKTLAGLDLGSEI